MANGLFASWPGRVAVGVETAVCKNKDGGINWISIYIPMLICVNLNGKLSSDMGRPVQTLFRTILGGTVVIDTAE